MRGLAPACPEGTGGGPDDAAKLAFGGGATLGGLVRATGRGGMGRSSAWKAAASSGPADGVVGCSVENGCPGGTSAEDGDGRGSAEDGDGRGSAANGGGIGRGSANDGDGRSLDSGGRGSAGNAGGICRLTGNVDGDGLDRGSTDPGGAAR